MSRSEGRTGEYERDERARDLHVDRYVSESDRIGSAVLPAPLEFERGRPGLRSLFESRERESESATVSPPDNLGCLPERFDSSRPFRVALGVEHHSEASHP